MDKNKLYGLSLDESCLSKSRIFSRRNHLLQYCKNFIPEKSTVSEVGVAEGFFSQTILDTLSPQKMYLVDLYEHNSPHHEYNRTNHYSYIINKFGNNDKISIMKGLSWECLDKLPSESLDFIYIDGDHSYESVKKDIVAAYRIIKSGGIIQFNDYTTFSPVENMRYGVLHAVNEFLQTHNVEVLGLSLDKNGYEDLAVRVLK